MTAESAGIFERDLQGFKHFRSLRKLLSRLHEVGTKRDTAGNRQLHMAQYCVLVLVWCFNPAIRTLRGLQRVVEFNEVRKLLGVNRTSLGSLSESVRIFTPTALAHIAAELSLDLPTASARHFDAVQQQLTRSGWFGREHHRAGRSAVVDSQGKGDECIRVSAPHAVRDSPRSPVADRRHAGQPKGRE